MMNGDVDEGYGKVADAFRRNLDNGQEVGAACSVYRDGRKVVDLWGGARNRETGAPWKSDTLVNVFSTTKGVASDRRRRRVADSSTTTPRSPTTGRSSHRTARRPSPCGSSWPTRPDSRRSHRR